MTRRSIIAEERVIRSFLRRHGRDDAYVDDLFGRMRSKRSDRYYEQVRIIARLARKVKE